MPSIGEIEIDSQNWLFNELNKIKQLKKKSNFLFVQNSFFFSVLDQLFNGSTEKHWGKQNWLFDFTSKIIQKFREKFVKTSEEFVITF